MFGGCRLADANKKLESLEQSNNDLKYENIEVQKKMNRMKEKMAPTLAEAESADRWRQENDELRKA